MPTSHQCSHSLQNAYLALDGTLSSRRRRQAIFYHLSSSRALSPESDAVPAWTQILDPKAGFLVNGCITVSATVLVLEESMQFTRDTDSSTAAGEESLR